MSETDSVESEESEQAHRDGQESETAVNKQLASCSFNNRGDGDCINR